MKGPTMDVKLIFSKDNGATKDIPITDASTVIGRAKDCNLRIPIESCSRRQCELILENGTFTLRDLNSSNGTIVNNTPTDEKVLVPGDRITIGPVTLTVCIDGVSSSGQPQAAAPVEDMEELVSEAVLDEAPADDLEELLVIVDDEDPAEEDPLAALSGGGPSISDDDPLAALTGMGGTTDDDDDDIDMLASLVDDDDDEEDDNDPLAALASLTE